MLTNPATWYKMPSSLFLLSRRTPQGGLFWSQRASGDISLWHKSLFGRGRWEFTCIRERGDYAGCTWRVDFNIFCCVSFSSSDYKNCVMKTYHTLQRNSSLFHRSQISKIIFWAKALNSKGQWLHGWFWFSPWASEGSMRWRRRSRRRILERCSKSLMVITSLELNCDDKIHRSESLHNVLLFTHNVIHTNQTFQLIVLAWSESPNQSFMFRSFCTVKWPKNDPNSNWTEIGHKREMWNETQYLRSVCTTKRVTQFWYRSLK